MKKITAVIIALVLASYSTLAQESGRTQYQVNASRWGFSQRDSRFTIICEDYMLPIYVKYEGIGYEYKEGFDTKVRKYNCIYILITSASNIDSVNPEISYYRITDGTGTVLYNNKGIKSTAKYEQGLGFYSINSIILRDVSYPITVETIWCNSTRNTFIIQQN